MKKNLLIFSLFPLLFFASSGHAYSETVKLSQDGGMEIEIVHPDSVLNVAFLPISSSFSFSISLISCLFNSLFALPKLTYPRGPVSYTHLTLPTSDLV